MTFEREKGEKMKIVADLTLSLPVLSADKTFANSLDQDQAQQDVGHDRDPICLTH